MQQAGAGAGGEHAVGTGAQQKGLLQDGQGLGDGMGRGEGAKILAFGVAVAPVLDDLRKGVVPGDQNVGEGFVVTQQDVVAGFQLLDQVGFKQQGFRFSMGVHHFHADGFAHHPLQAQRQGFHPGIGDHPFLQAFGLTHIQRVAVAVQHPVDAGAVRQGAQGGADHLNAMGQAGAVCRGRAGGGGEGGVRGKGFGHHGRDLGTNPPAGQGGQV